MMQHIVEMGYEEAAARLLAELAHSALSVACTTIVQLVNRARPCSPRTTESCIFLQPGASEPFHT